MKLMNFGSFSKNVPPPAGEIRWSTVYQFEKMHFLDFEKIPGVRTDFKKKTGDFFPGVRTHKKNHGHDI